MTAQVTRVNWSPYTSCSVSTHAYLHTEEGLGTPVYPIIVPSWLQQRIHRQISLTVVQKLKIKWVSHQQKTLANWQKKALQCNCQMCQAAKKSMMKTENSIPRFSRWPPREADKRKSPFSILEGDTIDNADICTQSSKSLSQRNVQVLMHSKHESTFFKNAPTMTYYEQALELWELFSTKQ